MQKIIVVTTCLMAFSLVSWTQTLGEKYKLPEEAGQLRTDGVYHLPASLLPEGRSDVEAYFRFLPDSTFIIFHSRLSPETKPENFQINCNYASVSSGSSLLNKAFTLKTKGNISRARIGYTNKFVLLEMDVRKDVISLKLSTFDKNNKRVGQPDLYVMPFHQISWPMAKSTAGKR